jgi:hypothetical protein
MSSVFAMAGLAEAALARDLVVQWFFLISAFMLAIVAWWRCSWIAITLACAACLCVAVSNPWASFRHPEFPYDQDEMYWLIRYRIAAATWFILSIGCFAGLVLIIRRNRRLQSVCLK